MKVYWYSINSVTTKVVTRIDHDGVKNEREVGLDTSMVILDIETEDLVDNLIGIGRVMNDPEGMECEVDWAKGLRSLA